MAEYWFIRWEALPIKIGGYKLSFQNSEIPRPDESGLGMTGIYSK